MKSSYIFASYLHNYREMKMKYTIESILEMKEPKKFLFFWGHRPSMDGSITKSCFSQWWESSFEIDGKEYKTAEHYMMAEKARLFTNPEIREQIIACESPAEAKKLGRKVQGFDQKQWEEERFEIVKRGNLEKFRQNESLAHFLQSTHRRILVEASPVDPIWGIGMAQDHKDVMHSKEWRGLNLLGFALMEVREALELKIE